MKKFLVLLSVGLLSGCAANMDKTAKTDSLSELALPKSIKHNDKNYQLKEQQDLQTIARYVYFEGKENLKNWKSAVELLLDRNPEQRSLSNRIQLRQRVYENTGVEHFKLYEEKGDLYAFVIYKPSPLHNDWQVDVARGHEVENCGFVQYQYSLKIPKSKKILNMGQVKLIGYLKKYVVDKELARIAKTPWRFECVKPAGAK
ncbi:hypothetical protein EDC45_0195 [Mesocricetibacter intestinalis]|uniref:Lipoprotein n=1 Tax=Mesocricetibacter intestinalis TaxID=1521930 RepID=A0A4R6VEZ3_9PAST|nr:6-phosphofructokinase [Mesocricetibacter intestinalis]TDQ59545.1 hypothetical protein EDC45_0195 [Mesocricetibacter intestinalis]